MNREKHNHHNTSEEHGTVKAYVIGFVLSLVFTLIPYHLVVNKVMSGSILVVAILGIAVLQMFIQLFFFLHLGRGPKPLYNVVFFFATAGIIVLTVGASLFIMDNLYRNMSPEEVTRRVAQNEGISQVGGQDTGACSEIKQNHVIVITDGVAAPALIEASRCETISFINNDPRTYDIVFGMHTDHISYGGEYEIILDDGRPETLTLNQVGTFIFHSHNEPSLHGTFIVEP